MTRSWIVAAALVAAAGVVPARAQTAASDKSSSDKSSRVDPRTWSVWEAADGSYRVDFFGGVQAQYELAIPDGETNRKMLGPDFVAAEPGASSLLRIRRARLGAQGHVWTPALQYHVQLELAGSSASLKRVYVNWKVLGSALQLEAGKFKVPFGRQRLTSYTRQQLVDRAVASDEFAKGEDDGVMLWGTPFDGKLAWYAGVFNGEGSNANSQQDARNLWAGRIVWSPLGEVPYAGSALSAPGSPRVALGVAGSVNGGWLYEVNGVPGLQGRRETCAGGVCSVDHGDDATVSQGALEVAAMWGRASVSGEVFRRRIAPAAPGLDEIEAAGWYVQGGVLVIPERMEVGGRVGALDRDLSGAAGEVREASPFVNWFIHGDDLKVQADFTWLSTRLESNEWLRDRRTRVALIAVF